MNVTYMDGEYVRELEAELARLKEELAALKEEKDRRDYWVPDPVANEHAEDDPGDLL